MIAPLRFTLELNCPPGHAFEVWTARASLWWPKAHTMSGETGLEVVFEPRVGGHVYDRGVDGSERR